MEPLIILAVTFILLWVFFILPQQRRVRAHQALVASVQPGDQVILSAGIHGRIVELGPEDLTLEIADGVEIRVARQAVLRLVEDATGDTVDTDSDTVDAGSDTADAGREPGSEPSDVIGDAEPEGGTGPDPSDPDHRGPAAPGPNE
jgi:preprotein translocase subunit YajC